MVRPHIVGGFDQVRPSALGRFGLLSVQNLATTLERPLESVLQRARTRAWQLFDGIECNAKLWQLLCALDEFRARQSGDVVQGFTQTHGLSFVRVEVCAVTCVLLLSLGEECVAVLPELFPERLILATRNGTDGLPSLLKLFRLIDGGLAIARRQQRGSSIHERSLQLEIACVLRIDSALQRLNQFVEFLLQRFGCDRIHRRMLSPQLLCFAYGGDHITPVGCIPVLSFLEGVQAFEYFLALEKILSLDPILLLKVFTARLESLLRGLVKALPVGLDILCGALAQRAPLLLQILDMTCNGGGM